MLTWYRRHNEDCPKKSSGRDWKRCKCPIWMDGTLNGKGLPQPISLKTRDSREADERVTAHNAAGRIEPPKVKGAVTVAEAITEYRAEMAARRMAKNTQAAYASMLKRFQQFCTTTGIRYCSEITLQVTERFRQSWPSCTQYTAQTRLAITRCFFEFMQERDYLRKNWALSLRLASGDDQSEPGMPFSVEEMRALLDGIERAPVQNPVWRKRLRAACLLMRYSGLRRLDALKCSSDRLSGNRLYLYTTRKTKVPIFAVLPTWVVAELNACPPATERYWFWDEWSSDSWLFDRYRKLFAKARKLAGLPTAHFHQFRDTYAVELLNAGKSLEEVQYALGHKSIQTTQNHYGHWLKNRQDKWEREMERIHANDPLAQMLETSAPVPKQVQ